MPLWVGLSLVPVLIGLNAFFVIAEYALVSVRSSQIEGIRVRGGRRSAAAMGRLKADMASAIGAIQVCITMTNLLLGWIGEPAMTEVLTRLLAPLGVVLPRAVSAVVATALGFLVVTLLTVVLSELVPKAVTLQYTEPMARLTAVPMLRIQQAIRPLVWVMNAMANLTTRALGLGPVEIEGKPHTAEEIRVITAEAGEAGILTPRERSLILNSLGLGRKTARQVMVPRVRVAYLDLRWSMAENVRVLGEYLYSRMPLCDGGMDRVVGLVYTKEFVMAYEEYAEARRTEPPAPDDAGAVDAGAESAILTLLARPAVFVPVTIPLDRLLGVFHEKRTHLVYLVDEYGGVAGIVTLTDVVDEVLGPMVEAADELRTPALAPPGAAAPGSETSGAAGFVVPGAAPVHEIAERLGRPGWGSDVPDVATVNGLLVAKLGGRFPRVDEAVAVDGVTLRVLDADAHGARRVQVEPRAAPDAG